MRFKFKCDVQDNEPRCATLWLLFYLKGQSVRSELEDYAAFALSMLGLRSWISLDKIYYLNRYV